METVKQWKIKIFTDKGVLLTNAFEFKLVDYCDFYSSM